MRRWLPVSAERLHRRRFESESFRSKLVTLFPFFDRRGEVKFVLVVDANSSILRVIRSGTADFSFGIFGGIRLAEGTIHRLNDHTLRPLSRLFHFDPWWLLKDERFKQRYVIDTLKATNCAGELDDKKPVSFSGDLRRAHVGIDRRAFPQRSRAAF